MNFNDFDKKTQSLKLFEKHLFMLCVLFYFIFIFHMLQAWNQSVMY